MNLRFLPRLAFCFQRVCVKVLKKQLDVLVDTKDLEPGDYQLLLSQVDDKTSAVPFKLLPNAPKLTNLPVLANSGVATQHYLLKGERLDAIARLEATGVTFDLDPLAQKQANAPSPSKCRMPPPQEPSFPSKPF